MSSQLASADAFSHHRLFFHILLHLPVYMKIAFRAGFLFCRVHHGMPQLPHSPANALMHVLSVLSLAMLVCFLAFFMLAAHCPICFADFHPPLPAPLENKLLCQFLFAKKHYSETMDVMRPVELSYYPDQTPPDLVQLNANIDDLDFGENNYTCLFRLISFWDENNVLDGHEDRWVYSQWIDMLEHRIEGYTEPGGVDAVRELLLPGAIYRMENPFLIPARRILRSCPGDFALQIWPRNLLDRIPEDPARPFFPLQSFNIVNVPRLQPVDQLRTTSSDIIGRLSGVTRPTATPSGGVSFKLLIDHPSNERVIVRYSRFRPRTPIDLSSIAALERLHPVICILTAVTMTNPGEDVLTFANTPASRILFPPFTSQYRSYFDMFAHLPVPVRMMHPRRAHHFAYLRGELPDKLYLSALLRQHPAMLSFQNHQSAAWCLVRLLQFDRNSPSILPSGVHFRYSVLAKCADATATANIIFTGTAASLLFRMPPEEYALLPEPDQHALFRALQGHLFIIEAQPVEPGNISRAQFVATNIWDPVVAFY